MSGSEWLITSKTFEGEMSPLGKVVADLLGQAFRGIYHLSPSLLAKTDWSDPYWIAVGIYGSLATYDYDMLTRLVVLSNDKMLRLQIEPYTFNHLRLVFHQRKKREGENMSRIPYLDDHIASIRDYHRSVPMTEFPPEAH